MTALIKRRQIVKNYSVPAFLKSLGIDFRPSKGDGFWTANRLILRELYQEAQKEVRVRVRELHPDAGGDPEAFRQLMVGWRQIQRAFSRQISPATNGSIKYVRKFPPPWKKKHPRDRNNS